MQPAPKLDDSDYAKELRWRKDTRAFIVALCHHWQWWSSSILGSAIGCYLAWRGFTIPAWILWIIAILGILVGAFKAWRHEYRRAEANTIFVKDGVARIQEEWLRTGRLPLKGPCSHLR